MKGGRLLVQMESGIIAMLILGFTTVILISLIVIIMLWIRVRLKAFSWFLAQIVLLSMAFFKFTKLLIAHLNLNNAMLSEENSLVIGVIGVLWACSMLCMLIGIYNLSNEKLKDTKPAKNKKEYTPSFKNALGMLSFYYLLCPIIFSLIIAVASKVIGFSDKDPIVSVVITMAGLGLLVLWLRRNYIINLKIMFSMKKTAAIFYIPMILTIIGSQILLSEVANLTTFILPMNDFWLRVFEGILGDISSPWKGILSVAVVAPIVEEIIFRGIILRGFLTHYSVRKSIFLSAFLFGLVHMNPWQFVTAFVFGIILGWWYVKTESITTTILGHALNNGLYFIVGALGLNIPGYNVAFDITQHQPLWFDLLGVVLLAGGILWLIKLFNARQLIVEETAILEKYS